MGQIVIKCPTTGRWVSTGIGTDRATFEDPTNKFTNNRVQCPACGQMHTWNKEDGRYVD